MVGDLHIPYRAKEVPGSIRNILQPGRVQHVFCTGNICSPESLDWLKSMAPKSFHTVRGECEEGAAPDQKVVKVGAYRVGLLHGHQVVPWGSELHLLNRAKEMEVDILISGHTHRPLFKEYEGTALINPGSLTGAFSDLEAQCLPSFALLEFKEKGISVHHYALA